MTTLLISDLHLAPERPEILRQFVALLRGRARDAQALYILGDLFEAWIGDDSLDEPFNATVAAELAALCRAGVPVRCQHGNRDFLLGERFARDTGVELLAEEVVVELAGVRTLLMHGDHLCTDDTDYQGLRAEVRSPAWRAGFLARPMPERATLAITYRRQSMQATARKPAAITDVNAEAVAAAFRRHRCDRMIHGHTHRPAAHRHVVDGRNCERWVLADWYAVGSCLAVDAAGIATVSP